MDRYIDADKTLAYISRLLGGLPLALLNECEKNGIDIVRCKNCKHWAYGKDICTLHDMGMMADDYCTYGEREDEPLPEYDHSDPVDIHDKISAGFSRIEKAIREESAKMAEIIREAIAEKNPPVYVPQCSPVEENQVPLTYHSTWVSTIPEACKHCGNHPSNGGSGICHCTLGMRNVT